MQVSYKQFTSFPVRVLHARIDIHTDGTRQRGSRFGERLDLRAFTFWSRTLFKPLGTVYEKRMISVVILAHNEADEIGGLLGDFTAFEGLELIVAEDASTDHTPDIVQEFATRNSNVILSSSSVLAGKGAALRRGLALATGEVLGFVDGDASIHPSDFMRVAATIEQGADLAVGSRRLRGSIIARPQPLSRRLFGSIYRTLAHLLLDTAIRDFQCGCKAFRREVWDAITITCDGFAFDAELIAKAHREGFNIVEVPITWSNKANSKVKMRRDVIPMLRCLLSVRAEIRK